MILTGWGRHPKITAEGRSFETDAQLAATLAESRDCIMHGMGRSYGDSALNRRVIFSRRFDKMLNFDPAAGVLVCESGVTLKEIVDIFLPRGWFLPVTPGTKFVTVGGAVAADVHGKNHHKDGCFSESVVYLDVMGPGGGVIRCSRSQHPDLFRAVCGGMGLTGVILRAALRLRPVKSAMIRETVIKCANLEEIFHQFDAHDHVTYSVGWIDCLAQKNRLGRSVLMLGEHANSGRLRQHLPKTRTVPVTLPGACLNPYSIALFNHVYYHAAPDFVEGRLTPLDKFFYPLDGVGSWNRMYGRRGFTQYQMAIPKDAGLEGMTAILDSIARSGMGSFLGVIKLFGLRNDNYLSFPMEGCTLALDFKIQPRLFPFLDELDRVVVDYGGRLYLAKDVRMSEAVFKSTYSRWEDFAGIREKWGMTSKFNSVQSRRLGV